MSNVNFEEIVKRESDEIAKKNKITKYHLNVKGDEFSGDNYTSKIVHAQIIEGDGEKRQINLLFKLALMNSEENRKRVPSQDLFEAEVKAYTVIFPEFIKYQEENNIPHENRFKYTKFYKGDQDFLKEFVIMEDLSFDDYFLYGKTKPLDYEYAQVILKTLATYHAASFAMKAKDPLRFAKLKEIVAHQVNYPEIIYTMMTGLAEKIIPFLKNDKQREEVKEFAGNGRNVLQHLFDSTLTDPYNVICHGDLWTNNMLFKRKDANLEVMFLDYQLIRYASPATDILYSTYVSTEKQFRDEKMPQLYNEYYDTLGKCLQNYGCDVNELYPRQVFDEQLENARVFGMLFGLISCTFLFPKPGEEKSMDDFLGDMSKMNFTATDRMIQRLEDMATEISEYYNKNGAL